MAKKNTFQDIVNKIKNEVDKDSIVESKDYQPYIPDIIEFCDSPNYLDLTNPINQSSPYPIQRVILKCFYRGQRGNEHVKFTDDEIQLLKEYNMEYVLDKYYSKHTFRELVLILGRRSGKGHVTSIIALYEAMKLLELPGGNPFAFYKVSPGNPIYIITVATAADQAKVLFNEIRTKIQRCAYFKDKIARVTADEICLLTPDDKKMRDQTEKDSMIPENYGSVVILSGHSNSQSLLGKRAIALLFDEVASFKTFTGASSGSQMYSDLGPCTADFKIYDENNKPLLDSKIISISSPRGEEGILFQLWIDAPKEARRLAFQLPTWKVNQNQTEQTLREEFKFMSPSQFAMEFGAEFAGSGGEKFIADQYIENAKKMGVEMNLGQRTHGVPGVAYYAHLDPASTSHNYGLVVAHIEDRIRIKEEKGIPKKERYKLFVVDHVKMWQPQPEKAISVHEVDDYVIDLARRFSFVMVTYDTWESMASIQKLRAKGIPTKQTPFRRHYKMSIYNHLEHLLVNSQLALPSKSNDAQYLLDELKCLKKIFGPNGFKIKPDPEAYVKTDDLCDAVAGVCGMAIQTSYSGYAKGGTVYLPQTGTNDNIWNIGRGTYANGQWEFLSNKLGR